MNLCVLVEFKVHKFKFYSETKEGVLDDNGVTRSRVVYRGSKLVNELGFGIPGGRGGGSRECRCRLVAVQDGREGSLIWDLGEG